VAVLIQPALGLLKPDAKKNLPFLYHLAAVAVVAVPTVVAQGFVRTATGDLTHLKDSRDVASVPAPAEHTFSLLHPCSDQGQSSAAATAGSWSFARSS
jgi:hypothetical protein